MRRARSDQPGGVKRVRPRRAGVAGAGLDAMRFGLRRLIRWRGPSDRWLRPARERRRRATPVEAGWRPVLLRWLMRSKGRTREILTRVVSRIGVPRVVPGQCIVKVAPSRAVAAPAPRREWMTLRVERERRVPAPLARAVTTVERSAHFMHRLESTRVIRRLQRPSPRFVTLPRRSSVEPPSRIASVRSVSDQRPHRSPELPRVDVPPALGGPARRTPEQAASPAGPAALRPILISRTCSVLRRVSAHNATARLPRRVWIRSGREPRAAIEPRTPQRRAGRRRRLSPNSAPGILAVPASRQATGSSASIPMAPARRAMAVERVTLHVIGRPAKATTPGPDPVALERVTQTVVDRLDRTIEERVRKQLRPNSEQVRRLTEHICSDLYQHVVLEAERTGGRFGP